MHDKLGISKFCLNLSSGPCTCYIKRASAARHARIHQPYYPIPVCIDEYINKWRNWWTFRKNSQHTCTSLLQH